MKPLHIALICKNKNSTLRDNRAMGYFSYDVPEFTWNHILPGKRFDFNWRKFKNDGYDLVIHEDYPYGIIRNLDIPYIFLCIDSTLSTAHFNDRYKQAAKSDLILVDHDNLNKFSELKPKAIQFPYCVNDKVFYKYTIDEHWLMDRPADISYHCSSSAHSGIDERKRIRQLLSELSVKYNWTYRSGILPLEQYAESFRTAKIVVNQSRTSANRPHRIFDAMACGAMVLSSPIPYLDNDKLISGYNYMDYYDDSNLLDTLNFMLDKSHQYELESIAKKGYNLVMQNHTWSIRATQLREIINKEFGI